MRTPGDELNPRWLRQITSLSALADWETGHQVADGRSSHGPDGLATIQLEDLTSGAYRIIYQTEDDEGRSPAAKTYRR